MSERKPPRASRPNLPGYGIVAENEGDGLLPWSWAASKLASARNYFLATITEAPSGARPHLMPIWGLWLDDTFQFSTGKESRKARNLLRNPRCVVCLEGGEESIVVEGVAEVREETPADFARAYQAKYEVDVAAMGQPIFVVRPRLVFAQIEKTFTTSATRWIFDD
jgi:Pyridoxamine 5'-phosphate oxidase